MADQPAVDAAALDAEDQLEIDAAMIAELTEAAAALGEYVTPGATEPI